MTGRHNETVEISALSYTRDSRRSSLRILLHLSQRLRWHSRYLTCMSTPSMVQCETNEKTEYFSHPVYPSGWAFHELRLREYEAFPLLSRVYNPDCSLSHTLQPRSSEKAGRGFLSLQFSSTGFLDVSRLPRRCPQV